MNNTNKTILDSSKLHNMDTRKVTRVEVIDHQSAPIIGRAYVKRDCQNVEVVLQDDGKTLKIFISKNLV